MSKNAATTNPETILTAEQVERGRAVVIGEANACQADVDACAYRAAMSPTPANREALSTAQARLQTLRGELDGLSAVAREVTRVERRAGREQALIDLAELERDTIAKIDAVTPAYDKARAALLAFADAWQALVETKDAARVAALRANPQAVHRGMLGTEIESVVVAVREEVLRQFGTALEISGILSRSPEEIARNAAFGPDRLLAMTRQGIAERRTAIEGAGEAEHLPEPTAESQRDPLPLDQRRHVLPGQPGAIYAVE